MVIFMGATIHYLSFSIWQNLIQARAIVLIMARDDDMITNLNPMTMVLMTMMTMMLTK